MGKETIIAWTDHTFNIAWGCVKVSPGCKHCYAERFSRDRCGLKLWGPNSERRTFGEKHWRDPLNWNALAAKEGRRHRVFSASMCDWCEDHPTIDMERARLWDTIRATPWLDWQLLTKRADRLAACLPEDWGDGYPNVWLGVSIENLDYAWRAERLREIPAVVRFISYEPALGSLLGMDLSDIDWVIYGGESGPGFRDHDLQWAREMRAKCETAGTAFFFKQSAAIRTEMGTTLDGETIRQYPTPRKVERIAETLF